MLTKRKYNVRKYHDFPLGEYEDRIGKLRVLMANRGVEFAVFTTKYNVRYFTGFMGTGFEPTMGAIFAIIAEKESIDPVLVINEGYEGAAVATSWVEDFGSAGDCYGHSIEDESDVLKSALRNVGVKKASAIGLELGSGHHLGMTQVQLESIRGSFPQVKWVDVSDTVWTLRRVKSPREVEAIEVACEISAEGIKAGFDALRPGLLESELYGIIVSKYYREGAESHAMDIHSTAKGNQVRSCLPAPFPFERGHFMKIDGGAIYKGYHCDFCRLLGVGPVLDIQRECVALSGKAIAAAASKIRPGVKVSELHTPVSELLGREGYSVYWNAIGHGLGLNVHEPPVLYSDCNEMLVQGNVLSIEVGIVHPERFDDASFTEEDNYVVTESGVRKITDKLPSGLMEKVS